MRTGDAILCRVLALAQCHRVTELRLHGLTHITDRGLRALVQMEQLQIAGLTHCVRLTTRVKASLPRAVKELRVQGCCRMYDHLSELSSLRLDCHVCEHGLKAVEEKALLGFRFVDPALRAGIRQGHACSHDCVPCHAIADVHGTVPLPSEAEIWHASSFDWNW